MFEFVPLVAKLIAALIVVIFGLSFVMNLFGLIAEAFVTKREVRTPPDYTPGCGSPDPEVRRQWYQDWYDEKQRRLGSAQRG